SLNMWWDAAYDPNAETPDLTGKVALVTGGNAGIGYEVVKHLARHGAKVYMAARSEQRCREAIAKLREEGILKRGTVEFLRVDLSSLKDVKRAADVFESSETKLDILGRHFLPPRSVEADGGRLVNNAAVLPGIPERIVTEEGIVSTLAVNTLAHFALLESLLPLLKRAASAPGADVRIVNVTSETFAKAPRFEQVRSLKDLDVAKGASGADSLIRYGVSKLGTLWVTHELQSRLNGDNIDAIVMAVDPGGTATAGARDYFNFLPWPIRSIAWRIVRFFIATPEVGAYPILFASTSKKIREGHKEDRYKGALLRKPNKIVGLAPDDQAVDPTLAKQFWELSEKVVKEVLEEGQVTMDWEPSWT
ncbi:hypothetical protein FRB99_003797, partial [Tulasnella sp. 403]